MNIISIIDTKRQGKPHTQAELAFIVNGMMAGEIADYQLAAWLMAVCCQGLNMDETTWLTDLYVQSGQTLDFSGLNGIVVDKHSTGGVGDKTTLILGPLLAACGLKVAKLSGRGLGFTGGTADKLEAIPGFNVSLSSAEFLKQVNTLGIALGTQTADLAPADGKLYALRDVTATVASIPLIAASVVSKKIAAGAQVITLDIKYGEGAFMKTLEEAKDLAQTCREVGKRLGKKVSTVISGMTQPLGEAIGHTVEVMETIETLKGQGPEDLTELCLILAGVTLVDAGLSESLEAAKTLLRQKIQSGEALAMFAKVITAQGGDASALTEPEKMPQPAHKITITAKQSGFIAACHALKVAEAGKLLGAGRLTKSAPIDLSVGVWLHKKIGDTVQAGEAIATLWANQIGVAEATQRIEEAFEYSSSPVMPPALVAEMVSARQSEAVTSA